VVEIDRQTDPFVLEILHDSLIAIADEMFVTTQRTSQSTIIYEVLDFAVALLDADGNLITQGNGVTLFLATLRDAVRNIREKFAQDEIYEGDIFVTNDPYTGGGTHLSDVTVVMPIFYGGELVAFAGNKAHWTEVGGRDPGSVATDTTEIYQEGLQLTGVKIFERGEPNRSLFDIIEANVRVPAMSIGDLHAQAASVRLAAQRFVDLCDKHGKEVVQSAVGRILEHSAELARIELEKLPKGVYEAVDWVEKDADGRGPFKLCVKVTIRNDAFICDFTGTTAQMTNSLNCSRTGLISACRVIYKAIVGHGAPLSEGMFKYLDVKCPPGTIFTCERPAATSTYYEVLPRCTDLVWKALATVVPDRLTAGHFVSICADLITGPHPETDELFILFEPNCGGWGAGFGQDGQRGLVSIGDGETFMIPVEVAEMKYGVRVEQYAFNIPDGHAGAGQWRGGEGIVRDYRITARSATATGTFTRHEFPPWAVEGGREGSCNSLEFLYEDGARQVVGMISRHPVKQGEIVRISTGTGGGWGNPLARDPSAVAKDAHNGFITCGAAQDVYGVIVDPETFQIVGETDERRSALASLQGGGDAGA
jgi:N-methylhydantoinase B